MGKLVKIAEITANDENSLNYIAGRLENTGVQVVYDEEYPYRCFVIKEVVTQ